MKLSRWYESARYIELDGHRHFVHEQGKGPVLLCLHGLPGASWTWHKLLEKLTGFRVIAPDLLGIAYSDKPDGQRYSVVAHCDRTEALLAALGITNFHVMGQGLGGIIATELLARAEGRLAEKRDPRINPLSLFLINAPLFPELAERPKAERWLAGRLGGLAKFLATRGHFWQYLNALSGPYSRPTPDEVAQLWQLMRRDEGRWLWPAHAAYHGELLRRGNRWVRALRNTQRPVRLVAGPEDPIAGHRLESAFRRSLPELKREMLGKLGHMPQFEAPDKLLPVFTNFHQELTS